MMSPMQILRSLASWALPLFLVLFAASHSQAQSVTTIYFHNDAQNSPVAATNDAGQLIWQQTYTPFGGRQQSIATAAPNDVWFHEKPTDESTGLQYFGARWYDPVLGRFMGMDPVGPKLSDIHSFNAFLYGNGNPYRFRDPDGRDSTAQIIDYQATIAAQSGDRLALAGWAAFGAVWDLFGAESLSQMYDKGGAVSGATMFGAGVDLLGALPGVRVFGGTVRSAVELGRAGEAAADIVKNTERIASESGTAAYRVPDILDHSAMVIGEVKNVESLSYTSQLRDFASYASGNGYTFELWVRPTTQLSGPLQEAVSSGEIVLRFLP